jgi:hypothetical protein
MSICPSPLDYDARFDNFAAIVEAAAEPYDPNITYLVGGKAALEPVPVLEPAKSSASCLSIINQIVSGKASKPPPPTLNLENSRLFKAREARLKAAAEAALVSKEAAI